MCSIFLQARCQRQVRSPALSKTRGGTKDAVDSLDGVGGFLAMVACTVQRNSLEGKSARVLWVPLPCINPMLKNDINSAGLVGC